MAGSAPARGPRSASRGRCRAAARASDGEAGPGAGEQFPPLDSLPMPGETEADRQHARHPDQDAMQRLADRQTPSGEARQLEGRGLRGSIHKIKEQVLPRLLERVDPEAAATLDKDELAEEFRPIIGEVLAELKLTLNRREQFALEKVLVDELLGLGPLEELLADPEHHRHHGQRPRPDLSSSARASSSSRRSSSATRSICSRSRSASCNSVGRRVDQTTPLADARLKDGSRVNVIVPPLSLARHRDLDS